MGLMLRVMLGLGVMVAAAWTAGVPAAHAHARLERSVPEQGAVVEQAPSQVELFFSQEIQKVSGTYGVTVERDGAPVTAGEPVVDDLDRTHLTVDLQTSLGEGRYVVRWHNVSDADGDPAEGAFAFYVGRQPAPEELALDEELAQIGAEEETPAADATEEPSPDETVVPKSTATDAPLPDDDPAVDASDDDDGANIALIVGLVVAGVVAVGVIGGGWALMRRR